MHTTTSRPTDIALLIALFVPLAVLGLLVAGGVPVGVAVCIQFVLIFAITTAMDIGWAVRRRRSRCEVRVGR